MKITTIDGRKFIGKLLSFDKYLNLVLSDTEESRIVKKSFQELKKNTINKSSININEEKRLLGLIILRGEQIVSLSIESGPTIDNKLRLGLNKGKGISKPLKHPVSQKSKIDNTVNTLKGPIKSNAGPGFKRL